ncbi:MAG: aldehyde ferredoxin oxidoreductase family protein [Desulfobacterales bacterium]|nr:aldehyde ferredoxin oxidoreductase family protein [Desulfobacterales bacterium]
MAGGYTGKYCIVNLTDRTTEVVEPGDEFYRKYLSGYGLGAAVLMERQKPGIDAMAPEAHLGFCTGLLTGTKAYFSGRFMVVGKSPLTGGWGDANAGGFLSQEIKRTGYDAVFFTGAADTPVWVRVSEDDVEILDADHLWGKDIAETEAAIRDQLGDKKVQVAAIGVSGEKLSLISGISTDNARIAARSGLGAVMGSKKLKAVSFRGQKKVPVADTDAVKEINKKFIAAFKKSNIVDRITVSIMGLVSQVIARTGVAVPAQASLVREIYKKYGTSGLTTYSAMTGDMPIKNWGGVGYVDFTYEKAKKGSDENVLKYQEHKYACQSCPLGCGGIIDIKKGKYQGEKGHKPEYETLGAFGGMLLQDDIDAIIELNEMCNRAGIDTISTGGAIAFAIECFENGIIDETTTGGLKLGWGKTEEIVQLAEMIIAREGFGDVLADGVKRAAEKIGKGADRFAIHAGGQELPMHDSRLDPGFAVAYQCEPTPGRHTIACYLYAGLFGVKKNFPAAKQMIKSAKGKMAKDVRRYTAASYYMQLVNCGGLCLFGAITSTLPVVEYFNAVTGWDLTPDEYLTTGARVLNLRKAFNMREGITTADHHLSRRALDGSALTKGPNKGAKIDMEALMGEFFGAAGWDMEKGGPTAGRMKELGLDGFAA